MFPSSRGLAVRDVPQRNWNRMRQTGFKLFHILIEKVWTFCDKTVNDLEHLCLWMKHHVVIKWWGKD